MISVRKQLLAARALAFLTAGCCLLAASPAQAQKATPLKKTGAAAKPTIAPGVAPKPGELLQVGTMYVTGTGDNRINVRIDKIDTAPSYKFIFAGEKKVQAVSNPQKFTYLIIHITVQNLSSRPRPIFNTDAGGKEIEPYLQMGMVRQYKNQYDGKDEAEYLQMDVQTYRREEDGLTLRLEGPREQYNMVQPGQTVHAFIAREVLIENDPLITQLQLNYFDSAVADEVGTGKQVRGAAKPTLMTFDLLGKIAKATAPAPAATAGNSGGIPWGDPATAGRRAEVGKTYRVGSGNAAVDITVEKIEAVDVPDGASEFGGGKRQDKVLLVLVAVHNPTNKPQLAFSSTATDNPWLQPALWSVNKYNIYTGARADYFFTPDGKTELTYVRDRDMTAKNAAVVQPGKTAKAIIRVEYTDTTDGNPPTFLRLNYSAAPNASLDLTAEKRRTYGDSTEQVAKTLLTFSLDAVPNVAPLSKAR